MTNKRDYWIDNIKIFACIFVVLGHLFQSFTISSILPKDSLYMWFNNTIYYFNVPLFFICSGYIYQKYSSVTNPKQWLKNIEKKSLSLLVPYFIFVIITVLIKTVFQDNVNTKSSSIIDSLFINPISPYWFLIALFLLFLVTPTVKSKRGSIILLCISVVLFFGFEVLELSKINVPSLIRYIMIDMVWLVFGMIIAIFKPEKVLKKQFGLLLILFLVLSVFTVKINKSSMFNSVIYIFMIFISCLSISSLIFYLSKDKQSKFLNFLSKYTMPIFLMHTICAAGIRIVLFKIGISNAPIHIICGLIGSFVLPIVITKVLELIKLDFFITPTKYIKIKTSVSEE